jgi:hypothetical protein
VVIVAVGSDKGAPGATTLATVFGLCWPGERVLCELDLRGADLPFRLRAASGDFMPANPSLITLAVDSRPGTAAPPPKLERYAQQSSLGIPVIRGEVTSRANSKVAPHLPSVAAVAARWPGAVIADVGSLQPSNPALVVAKAAAVVLLVVRPTTEGLGHLRARVEELSEYVGDPNRERPSVGVVLVAEARDEKTVSGQAQALLGSIGSPAPVVGVFAHDLSAVSLLWGGRRESRKLTRSSLVRSAEKLISRLFDLWPDEMTSWWALPTGPSPFQQQIGVMP